MCLISVSSRFGEVLDRCVKLSTGVGRCGEILAGVEEQVWYGGRERWRGLQGFSKV